MIRLDIVVCAKNKNVNDSIIMLKQKYLMRFEPPADTHPAALML